MRVLIVGDAGCHTGFATVIHAIGERLVSDFGHEVSVLASNYRGDYWPTNLRLYPASQKVQNDTYGMSRIIEVMGLTAPDAIIMLNDPGVLVNFLLNNPWDTDRVVWRGVKLGDNYYRPPILGYLPIDGTSSPGSWDILKERMTRIAMSKFGRDTAMPEADVIWHGVDTTVFHPRDKAEAKRAVGYDPDRFLIVRVDRNSQRKDFPSTWKALRPVLRRHPDIDVHFHCQENPGLDGMNMTAYRWNDEDIRDRVRFPDIGGFTGWGTDDLANLYAAADLFVSTSHGEGFGLPLLESIASGTPVIATDCSAIREVVGPGGVLIPPLGAIPVPMGQEQALPDVPAFTAAIEYLYEAGGVRRKLSKAGVVHAQQFSWPTAAEKMDVILKREVENAVRNDGRPATVSPVEVSG